jgi:uncharacterized protein
MDARFHQAQQSLTQGNVAHLAALLSAEPDLATARSSFSHPTILQCLVLSMPVVDPLEELIQLLADHGAELTNPLIAACGVGNLRAIKKLLDLGANIDGSGQWTPLEEALYWGQAEAVALLRNRGASVKNLRCAAALSDYDYIDKCFDAEGRLTAAAGVISWPFTTEIPEPVRLDPKQIVGNALVFAASMGSQGSVERLLDRGAAINMIPAGFDFAGTALHYAALRGRDEMVDFLLSRGADPSIRDAKIGRLAEDWAEHDGYLSLKERLRRSREKATAG